MRTDVNPPEGDLTAHAACVRKKATQKHQRPLLGLFTSRARVPSNSRIYEFTDFCASFTAGEWCLSVHENLGCSNFQQCCSKVLDDCGFCSTSEPQIVVHKSFERFEGPKRDGRTLQNVQSFHTKRVTVFFWPVFLKNSIIKHSTEQCKHESAYYPWPEFDCRRRGT